MAFALVGSEAVVSEGVLGGALTPAYGTGQTRAAGNLLILWVYGTASSAVALPATPAGWTMAQQNTDGTNSNATVFYRVATGADAAPTVAAAAGTRWIVKLDEFSGGATTTPADQGSSATGLGSPIVATNAGADVTSGQLVVAGAGVFYNTAGTKTLAHTIANCSGTDDTNDALSVLRHYSFRWGTMSTNAAADSDSFAFTTMNITGGSAVAMQSFKLAAVAPSAGTPELVMAPISH